MDIEVATIVLLASGILPTYKIVKILFNFSFIKTIFFLLRTCLCQTSKLK